MRDKFKKIFFKKTNNWINTDKPADFFVHLADIDYLTARLLLHTGFIYPVLFHSHQALEKYLKAILVQEKKGYLGIHSLKRLINKTKKTELFNIQEIKRLRRICDLLDKQYETARYGGETKYNFFVNIIQIFVRENRKERKAIEKDGLRVAGIIMLPPNHLKTLDEAIATIRPKIKKTVNHLKAIIEEDPEDLLVKGWKFSFKNDEEKKLLALNIKSLLVPNDYLEELKK